MRAGILDMLAAVAAFTIMLALAKVGGDQVRALELVVWRGWLGGLMLLPWAGRAALRISRPGLLVLRTVLGATAMMCFFTAVQQLSVAEVSVVHKLQPVIVAVLAPLTLGDGEKPGPVVWTALGLGFAGTIVLVADGALSGSWWTLWAVGAAVFSAGAHTTLRALGRTESPRAVVIWFQLGAGTISYVVASATGGSLVGLPPTSAWPVIGGIALAATVGQLFMTRAYQRAQAAPVAATGYAGPLLAVLVDLAVFGLAPGWNLLVGGVLVVMAGLLLLFGGWPTRARLRAVFRRRPALED